MKKLFNTIVYLVFTVSLSAQLPSERMVKVSVIPNSKDWNYAVNENAVFDVSVTQNGYPVENASIRYELSQDMMEPFESGLIESENGKFQIDGGTLKTAGFLRCRVFVQLGNEEYEGLATAGYAPGTIAPTTQLPDDFREFWNNAKAHNSQIPLDVRLKLLPEQCTEKTNVYEVSFQNFRYGSRIYGMLGVPKAPGKYPAILTVPGAGVRSYQANVWQADKGIITLDIGIHGIPVTMDVQIYDDLRHSALDGYWNYNWDNRDEMYYKRVYMGCVKAVDYIFSMPEFDGENLVVFGGSQGGALSIITASLDSRVKGVVSFYPAISDLNGYLHGRAGGWPHTFKYNADASDVLEQKVKTVQYYDAVNFSRFLDVPVFYSFGYNDLICPPTTSYAVYNTIKSPTLLRILPETAHYSYPETWNEAWRWAFKILQKAYE